MTFILDGPVLSSFTDWLSPVAKHFPNRHVVGHGKYDGGICTEENSIKVFLMLDTLFHIMSAHQASTGATEPASASLGTG